MKDPKDQPRTRFEAGKSGPMPIDWSSAQPRQFHRYRDSLSTSATAAEVEAILARAEGDPDLGRKIANGRVVYEAGPVGSGLVVRIDAEGVRTLGRIVNRAFIEVSQVQPPR